MWRNETPEERGKRILREEGLLKDGDNAQKKDDTSDELIRNEYMVGYKYMSENSKSFIGIIPPSLPEKAKKRGRPRKNK